MPCRARCINLRTRWLGLHLLAYCECTSVLAGRIAVPHHTDVLGARDAQRLDAHPEARVLAHTLHVVQVRCVLPDASVILRELGVGPPEAARQYPESRSRPRARGDTRDPASSPGINPTRTMSERVRARARAPAGPGGRGQCEATSTIIDSCAAPVA